MGALYHPADLPESAAVRLATPGDRSRDASGVQRPAVFVVVVGAIGVDSTWLTQGAASASPDGWNRLDQRQELGNVVSVRPGQDDRDRRAVGVGGDVVLGT